MKHIVITILIALALGLNPAWAQGKKHNPLERYFYPAKLVIRYQQEIGLTDSQKNTIRDEMKKSQSKFFDLLWEMEKAAGSLEKLINKDTIDEKIVLNKMDEVLEIEHRIKKTHAVMLIRIRNLLSIDQRSQLDKYKQQFGQSSPGGRGGDFEVPGAPGLR